MPALNQILTFCFLSGMLACSAGYAQQPLDSSQFQPFPQRRAAGPIESPKSVESVEATPFTSLPSPDFDPLLLPLESSQTDSSPKPIEPTDATAVDRATTRTQLEHDGAELPAISGAHDELKQLFAEQFAKAYQQSLTPAPMVAEIDDLSTLGPNSFKAIASSTDTAENETNENLPHRDLNESSDDFAGSLDQEKLDWWKSHVIQGMFSDSSAQAIELNGLVYQALQNSPRILAISQSPLIRELQVIEADSVFDPVGFVRSNYNDRNDPVGNTLVTGGPPFLEDHIWSGDFGVKRKTRTGAKVEMGQKLGFQNSNSRFFVPQDQGTATLALNVTQPLLRGRGRYINQSQVLIAQANSDVAWSTFSEELQDELQQVVLAYWRLFYDRSLYLQKKRNVERGQQILDILQARQELDSMPSQIARARSAVELRKTEMANALRDIRNSETEIRRRIADRDWMTAQGVELVPLAPITDQPNEIPLEQIVHTALENRPEIKESLQRAKASGIQNQISENDLLPELSLLVGGYVSALNPESGVLDSWADQFGNRPGYNAGINFEMPYGNRAARSRLSQQKLQLIKIKAEVDETMQQVVAESQIAFRRVQSAIQTRQSALVSIEAARADLTQQASRWEQFGLVEGDFAEGQNPVILLNQVLDAQERLAAAELILAQADLELKVAEIGLQRTMGTLLMYQNVNYSMGAERDQPYLQLGQTPPAE